MSDPDLRLLAQRVRGGDRAAYRILVDRTAQPLFRLAARLLGNEADAEDALQEAYVKAYRALEGGRFDGRSEVRTWLYRIVTNAALDALRRRAVRPAGDDAPLAGLPDDGHASPDARIALREFDAWLGELPPDQRVAMVLCGVEGLSNAEAADVLGVSAGAVEQRLVRARATLRQKRGADDEA